MSSDTIAINSSSLSSVNVDSAPAERTSSDSFRLGGDELVDPLLHRAPTDELVHEHVLLLTDAKGPVGGLVLHGRVPPAVEVYDV